MYRLAVRECIPTENNFVNVTMPTGKLQLKVFSASPHDSNYPMHRDARETETSFSKGLTVPTLIEITQTHKLHSII